MAGAESLQEVIINRVGFLEPYPARRLQEILNLDRGEGIEPLPVCVGDLFTKDHARSLNTGPCPADIRQVNLNAVSVHLSQHSNERHFYVHVQAIELGIALELRKKLLPQCPYRASVLSQALMESRRISFKFSLPRQIWVILAEVITNQSTQKELMPILALVAFWRL